MPTVPAFASLFPNYFLHMDIVEIILSILGVIIYWFLSSRKERQKKLPTRPGRQDGRPLIDQKASDRRREEGQFPTDEELSPEKGTGYEPVEVDEEEEFEDDFEPPAPRQPGERPGERPAPNRPATFEELLEQFSTPKDQKQPRPARQQPQWEDYDEEFKPLLSKTVPRNTELVKHEMPSRVEDRSTIPPLVTDIEKLARETRKRLSVSKKKKNRYQRMLSNPESLRDAFVLKEIFDRKYID